MVEGHIKDQIHIPLMALCEKIVKVFQRSELGIDIHVIGGVIFVVCGGGENGCDPDPSAAEICPLSGNTVVNIIKAFRNSIQVSDSVAVRIGKRVDENFIGGPTGVRQTAFRESFREGLHLRSPGGYGLFGSGGRPLGYSTAGEKQDR